MQAVGDEQSLETGGLAPLKIGDQPVADGQRFFGLPGRLARRRVNRRIGLAVIDRPGRRFFISLRQRAGAPDTAAALDFEIGIGAQHGEILARIAASISE